MRAPPLLIAIAVIGTVAEAVPLVVLVAQWRRPRGARAWVAGWVAYLLLIDLASLALTVTRHQNLWLNTVLMPVSVGLALWALSGWQVSDLWRLTFRVAIVPLLLAWAVLTIAVEDSSSFSSAAEPMVKLVTLAAAAFTLLSGSLARRGDLLRQDWFWISAGMVLYFGVGATLGPVSQLLVHRAPQFLQFVVGVWALAVGAAFLLIAKGLTCSPTR